MGLAAFNRMRREAEKAKAKEESQSPEPKKPAKRISKKTVNKEE